MATINTNQPAVSVSVRTNLKCQSCLAKLSPTLDGAAEIIDWSADMLHPEKTVTAHVATESPIELLTELIEEAGFRAWPIDRDPESDEEKANLDSSVEPPRFRLATYKPLMLVVGYVTGFSLLMCYALNTWTMELFMRYFMGGFFLGFAFFKLLNVAAFADAFSTYDVIARRSRVYGLAYPFIELSLGVAFVLGVFPLIVNSITAIVMAVGLVGVIVAVRKKQAIQCACLGTAFNLPMSVVTIIENSVMIAMAIVTVAQIVLKLA
ncbi:MAG: hypothetical protein CMK32_06740 [Porticoccaceae bacterium]|nr:hypothetical protein [Porticoccaceae bacterium]